MAEQNCEPLSPSKGCDSAGLNLQTTGNRLPKDSGGGHEFVTELPQNGVEGVEYVLMDDLTDPATYKGTYIFNKASGTFIASSSGGGSGGSVDTAMSDSSTNAVQNKVIKQYVDDTKSDVESLLEKKVFVAEYNVTTSAEIRAYLDAAEEPFAPILVKRGNDYYTAILATKSGDNAAIIRVIDSGSGEFYLFTYTVTGTTWANSSYGLQKKLVSGTDIKTINGESVLGSGNIDIESATVFKAGTDYPYATMAAALDAGNVLIKDGLVNHPVVHFQDDSGESTLYIFVESGLQGSPSQVCYKWISGEYQEKTEKYIVPTGGTPGQVLTKKSTSIGDYGWADASAGGGAEFEITASSDSGTLGQGNDYLGVDLSDANGPTLTLTQPGTYAKSKTLQEKLVSGTNIKTVANQSLLGSGDVEFKTINNSSIGGSGNLNTGKVTADTQTNSISIYEGADNSVQISKDGNDAIRVQGHGKDDRGAMQTLFDMSLANKNYVDSKVGVHFAVDKETWYGTYTDENNVTYQVYTKTIYIPALPSAAGITTYPIGVTNMKQILSISGVTTDGFVLNAPRQTTSDNITIYQASKGSQTFSIEVGKDRSNKSAYVTIIYAKNN